MFSQIKWHEDKALSMVNPYTEELDIGYCFAQCEYCQEVMCFSYELLSAYKDPYDGWIEEFNSKMLYPKQIGILPAEDMPEHIKKTYREASLVFEDSPRASCALLRLVIEELLIYLRENYVEYANLKAGSIHENIKILVEKHNLSARVQQALDGARIVGNNAVHPGKLDIDDNKNIAKKLFEMINFIVEEIITKPKEIRKFYEENVNGERR